MSQDGLVSSNHYVVRIYPRILPPSALFPSLHPSRLFPSLPLWSSGRRTTVSLSFSCKIMHHLSSLFPETHQLIPFHLLASSSLLCVLSVMLQLTSTGLSLKCSLVSSHLSRPICVLLIFSIEVCTYGMNQSVLYVTTDKH